MRRVLQETGLSGQHSHIYLHCYPLPRLQVKAQLDWKQQCGTRVASYLEMHVHPRLPAGRQWERYRFALPEEAVAVD